MGAVAERPYDIDAAVDAFRQRLEQAIALYGPPETDPEQLGIRAAVAAGAAAAWTDTVGPFYDTRGAQAALGGVTKQAVAQRRDRRQLLGLRLDSDATGRSRWAYPVWQFRPELLEVIPQVLATAGYEAARTVSGWAIAEWLTNPGDDGVTPSQLAASGELPAVLAEASELVVRLEAEPHLPRTHR